MKSYQKYNWEVVANDFNSPFLRNYLWTKAVAQFPQEFGLSYIALAVTAKKNIIEYVTDMSTWMDIHKAIKERVLKDYHYVEKLIDKTEELGKEFVQWTKENIFAKDLAKLNGKELMGLLNEFVKKQGLLYLYGPILVFLDFHEFSFVEGNLNKFLKEKLSEEEYKQHYKIFTEPAYKSFAQEQEEDLLALMEIFYSNEQWVEDIKEKSLAEVRKLHPDFFAKLQEHTKKHTWVYYVYAGPTFTEEHFLDFIKGHLAKEIHPTEKLKEIADKRKEIEELKKKYVKNLQPDAFNEAILYLAGKIVWSKPRRKDYQSKGYYHCEKLMREIGKRLFISLEQARSAPLDVLEKSLVNGEKINLDYINSVYDFHACVPLDDQGTIGVLTGKEAEEFFKTIKRIDEDYSHLKEIKGTCACSGNAKGAVKIVNQPSDMVKFQAGDILISAATTPSVVPAMKKAAAIVTDEGGLTCHASIVSRELGIPCVVGTKFVTKALKDGDMVEVDADKGVVKKIG
jgi:phosphohistidine swiveling domain-containing protein